MNVQCDLCPKHCVIAPGHSGDCRIRINLDGKLLAVTYGHPCSIHIDPVEKKPAFHFLPGTTTFSLATVGCNLHCKNCQNWDISQRNPEDAEAQYLPPDAAVELAAQYGCQSVSYTYSDPVVFYEYTLDCCRLAHKAGLKNILVTAGYINQEPLRRLFEYVDSVRIDLKSMSDDFYRQNCGATLAPVLDSLRLARKMNLELEVIHLIIPTLNDRDEELKSLCGWVAENLGAEIPLHFSRFFPQYRLLNLPETPIETLRRAKDFAVQAGLQYVYIGNVLEETGSHTYCPSCHRLLVGRRGYVVLENHIMNGKCSFCGKAIYGVWQ